MAKAPTNLAPRYFKHSLTASGRVVPKRLEYPLKLRPSHVMVTGGREGALISGKKVGSSQKKTDTGWSGEPSDSWKRELELDRTPQDARTQGVFLRRVRPEQRAWARGVMRVPDIEYVLYGGLVPSGRIDLDVPGKPRVELTLWIADEGLFASITGRIEAIRVVTVEDASSIGVDEEKRTIRNALAVANTVPYAEMLGIVFSPDAEATFFGEEATVALPYYLVGRARRIHAEEGRPWRVASQPTPSANQPVDLNFEKRIERLEKLKRDALAEAGVAEALSPRNKDGTPVRPYSKDITLDVTMTPVGEESGFRAMRLTSDDRDKATSGMADELSLMNVFRTAGAETRLMQGRSPSVLKSPHDPLQIKQSQRRRKKKAPKDDLKMLSNPHIMGVNYTVVSEDELGVMARQAGVSVDRLRSMYPRFITRAEAKALRVQEKAARDQSLLASGGAYAPARRAPYRRLANPSGLEKGDHLYVPDSDQHCVVRRVMDDGRVIVQGFEPAERGERVRKYYPFQSVDASDLRNAEIVERGFADRMRALKAAGN